MVGGGVAECSFSFLCGGQWEHWGEDSRMLAGGERGHRHPAHEGEVALWFVLERFVITCPKCGVTSYNPNDVKYRYCGNCHAFHDEPARGSGLASSPKPMGS
jgi:hypothetical protein